jgi:hypothetical protein
VSYDFTAYGNPPESYSRQLDARVADTEMPYGYTNSAPPADSGDYDMHKKESKNEYPRKKGH